MGAGTATVGECAVTMSAGFVIFAWKSDAAGFVECYVESGLAGKVVSVRCVPSGAVAPTEGYNVTLMDGLAGGQRDLLRGQGRNQPAASTKTSQCPGFVIDGIVRLVIADAGNAKRGVVTVGVET